MSNISQTFANLGNGAILGTENMSPEAALASSIGQMDNKTLTPFKHLASTVNQGTKLFYQAPGVEGGQFAVPNPPMVTATIPITIDMTDVDENTIAYLFDHDNTGPSYNICGGCCEKSAAEPKYYLIDGCTEGEAAEKAYERFISKLCSRDYILKAVRLIISHPGATNYGTQDIISDAANMIVNVVAVNGIGVPNFTKLYVAPHLSPNAQNVGMMDIPLVGSSSVLDTWRHWQLPVLAGRKYQFYFDVAYRS